MRQDIRRQAGGEGYRRGWAEKPVGAELRNTRGRGCDDAMCEEAHTLSTQPPTSNLDVQPCRVPTLLDASTVRPSWLAFLNFLSLLL